MIHLLEDQAKAWLRDAGIVVPDGLSAATADDAARCAHSLGGAVFVKALVPAGRRGKANAVRSAASPQAAAEAAAALLGTSVEGYFVREVYVEAAIAIERELYCAFLFDDRGARLVVAAQGGVDIESIAQAATSGAAPTLLSEAIDPLAGIRPWRAIDLWHRVGIRGPVLRALGEMTSRVHEQFVRADAELLEINPLAIDATGRLVVVGAMVGIDSSAIDRHPQWKAARARVEPACAINSREHRVECIDAEVEGPEARYVELDGDIGLLVGGGGAGLYIHDRILANGGRPANHSVTPPTGADTRKLRAVIEAILDNPRLRTLLVGFNYAQMARADVRVRVLAEVLDERGIDTSSLPIVIRLFGAGEDEARARVAGRKGIHYLPRSATLDDAARLAVELARGVAESAAA